tara:strand:+ start:354 stop:575 length:222 start_codon:yes stop_codon:yes gene_type:complete
MEPSKEALTKLEWRVDTHDVEITLLKTTSSELKQTLDSIIELLRQIKWIAVGAGGVVFADQIGLMGILKLAAL